MGLLRPIPALAPDDHDGVEAFYREHGFALVRGLYDDGLLRDLDRECAEAQERLTRRELDARHGTDILDDPEAQVGGEPFAHYVCYVTDLSPAADKACRDAFFPAVGARLLGPDPWLLDYERFGVVYQDARTGSRAYYTRIGWHSDWQSGPHLGMWPSFAFTIHLDATSPANGFLRVVPGSHLGPPGGMPPAFERVPGEVAVYCERGDVLLHDAHLWHSAARATDDGEAGVRRHIRGGWFAGERLDEGHGMDDFVKNAAR